MSRIIPFFEVIYTKLSNMKSLEIFEKMLAKYLIKKTIKNQIWC